jgi:hypothetical protein
LGKLVFSGGKYYIFNIRGRRTNALSHPDFFRRIGPAINLEEDFSMNARSLFLAAGSAPIFAALLLAACAKAPTQEVADAETAVNTAIQAGAEEFASESLEAAQESLADAKAKVESKDYTGARMAAVEAKAKADAAAAAVEAGREAAKEEADRKMGILKPEVEAAAAKADALKGGDAEKLKADAAAIKEQWAAAQADYEAGSYRSASDKLDALQPAVDELKSAAEEAAKKAAPAKKKKK